MNYLDRRNKIQILQERANIYNQLQDTMMDQNVPEEQQSKKIYDKLDEHTISQLTHLERKLKGYNPNKTVSSQIQKPPISVLTTSALISLGLDQYKNMTTNIQDANVEIDRQYGQFKEMKRNGIPESYKQQLRKEKEEDTKRQNILFKSDHLKDFEDATHRGFKNCKSDYDSEFAMTPDIEEFLKTKDKRNNLQKNDLNTFFEVYIKHRSTLRK